MDIKPLEILKWIGIVLAAGFIGYFGRYLAMLIIEKVHKKEPPALKSSLSRPDSSSKRKKPKPKPKG